MKELKRNILIAFSGGCFSGKTTTMNKLLLYLSNKGYPVEVIRERARELMPLQYGGNIDLLRKNAKDYLEFEIDIISKKIQDEENARIGKSKKIYLIDRALSDSLFYLETYIDIKNLDAESIFKLNSLYEKLISKLSSCRIYDAVLEFKPIQNAINDDTFRPSNIDAVKYYEYNRIREINTCYFDSTSLFRPVNGLTVEELFNFAIKRVEYIIYKNGTEI